MLGAALAIGGLQGLSTMYGARQADKANRRAMAQANQLQQQALAELSQMTPIELASLGYVPEEIDFIKGPEPLLYAPVEDVQGQTISTDPATRNAQMAALEELQARAEGGLTAQDQYNFMKNRRAAETAARGRELAIQENLQQRGMGGTGIEAAMRMMASQSAADRLAESQAAQSAANAQMRLAGTQAQAGLAGDIRQQDIGVARSNADILNQFAWQNSERARQIANMNIDAQNRAAQQNIAEQRRVQGANVAGRNQAQLLNRQQELAKQEARQRSQQDIIRQKAGASLGQLPSIYAQGAADAASQRQLWNTIGQGIGTAGQMYMLGQQADQAAAERQKDRDLMTSLYTRGGGRTSGGMMPAPDYLRQQPLALNYQPSRGPYGVA